MTSIPLRCWVAIGNQTVDETATLTFTATATDADLPADTLTFSLDAASIALGMSIDANTGVFSWTPTESQGGIAPSVTITVTDSGTGNLVDSETFTITVNDTNTAPVLGAIGNQTVDELATLSFTATATDADLPADTLTFSLDAASIALGMSIDANTGVFSWTPTEAQGGTTPSVTITVTDNGTGNLVDSETFTITVNDTNTAPVLGAIGNQTVDELATLTFTATATDSDLPADTLTYSLDAASIALGMSIDANTGVFSWTPTEAQGGTSPSVTITVTDDGTGNLVDSETFTITVNDINTAPVLGAIGNQTVDELATLTFTATATDSDLPADTLTYSLDAASIALGMSIDANTGVFSWTPTEAQGGTTPSVTITVTDNGTGNLVDSETFTITVNEINTAPVLGAIGNQTVDELATLTFTATATDADLPADTLTYSLDAASIALGMTIDANTGVFSWTPTEGQGGTTPSVTITVTDDGTGNLIDSETFTITVNDTNTAPVLGAIGNQTVNELATLTFTATATDTDLPADTLTFSLDAASLAAGMTIDANTGEFSWTPTEAQGGTSPAVTITVTDSGTGNLIDSETFTITVNEINEAPITSGIANVTAGEDAPNTVIDLFAAFADDEDLDPALTYTITNNTNPGLFTSTTIDGVAGSLTLNYAADQNGAADITVRATDTGGQFVETTFTVTVNPVNDAPATTPVNLTPIREDSGSRLITQAELLANATDVDGPALTATNLTISNGSGTLVDNGDGTWNYTPAANDDTSVSFTNTVTDGSLTATGSATLDITPVNDAPVTNDDSAAVDEGQNVVINLVGNDVDVENALDLSSITITAAPANGTLVDNGDGTLTYGHDGSKTSSDSFSYTINDVSGATSNIAAVSLTVNPANGNDPGDDSVTNPTILLLEDPVTDEDDDSDVESPTYEVPGEDSLTEDEVVSPVEAFQTPQDLGDADESIVEIKDPQDEETQEIIYLTDEIDRNTQPEGRDDDRGYTYYDNDLYKDISLSNYLSFNGFSSEDATDAVILDNISFLDFDSDDTDPVNVNEDYDLLRQEIDESFNSELKSQGIKAKIVTATAATFTVGLVSYLLRAGSLVASMMSALPLWRGFDPIAIFSGNKKKKNKRDGISDAGELKPEAFFEGDAE